MRCHQGGEYLAWFFIEGRLAHLTNLLFEGHLLHEVVDKLFWTRCLEEGFAARAVNRGRGERKEGARGSERAATAHPKIRAREMGRESI